MSTEQLEIRLVMPGLNINQIEHLWKANENNVGISEENLNKAEHVWIENENNVGIPEK